MQTSIPICLSLGDTKPQDLKLSISEAHSPIQPAPGCETWWARCAPLPTALQRRGSRSPAAEAYCALPPAHAGSSRARRAGRQSLRGHRKALAVLRNAFCCRSPRRGLRRETEVSPGQRRGRGGRRERERMCLTTGCRAERRLRAGFLWGKAALSPCVDSPEHRQAPRGQDVKGRPEEVPSRPTPTR